MASLSQCHCCLLRFSAKDLKKPYCRLGITETYLVMIEECFAIKLPASKDRRSGICMVCVERLRESCRFKMQVLLCQKKLQSVLVRDLPLNDEDVVLLSDDDMCEPVSLCEEALSLPEVSACDEPTAPGAISSLPEPLVCDDDEPTTFEKRQSPLSVSDRRGKVLSQKKVIIKLDANEDRTTDVTLDVDEDRIADMTLDVDEDMLADMTTDFGEDWLADITTDVGEDRPAAVTTDVGENRLADMTTDADVEADRPADMTRDVGEDSTVDIKLEVEEDLPADMSGGDEDRRANVEVNVMRIRKDYEERLEKPMISEGLPIGEEQMSLSPDAASGASTASLSPHARQQLEQPCSVRLERLPSDEMPLASLTRPETSQYEPRSRSAEEQVYTRGTRETQFTVTASSIKHLQEYAKHTQLYTDMETNYSDLGSKQLAPEPILIRHNGTHELSKLICGDCNGTFANSMIMERHLKLHCQSKRLLVRREKSTNIVTPFRCAQCYKQFTLKWILNLHIASEHGGVGDYNVEFSKKDNIITYERSAKRKLTEVYCCNECNLQFSERDCFETHRRAHTEEKPHICEQCKNQFTSRAELERHFETHRRIDTEEKPHICDQCKNQFKSMAELERHKRIHSSDKSYECEICESIFYEETSLIKHLETHRARRQSTSVDNVFDNK